MDILSLAVNRLAVFVGAADQTTSTIDVRGYDVVGIWKDTDVTGTSLTFTGDFDEADSLAPIVDASNTAVTLTCSAATKQLCLFQQVKEIRALNHLAITTNGAAPGAGVKIRVGLRYIC
jgi:hypothetical protein